MRKILLFVLLIVTISLEGCATPKKIEKRSSAALAAVDATLPADKQAVTEAIRKQFNEKKNSLGPKFEKFVLVSVGDQIFPEDYQIQNADPKNSDLARYLAIDPSRRRSDFYLYEPTGDYYWTSEYYYNEAPAKFRCGFILHLEPEGNAHTKVEIFEYQPRVWAGEKLGWGAHGPGFFHDIKEVEPTMADRVELLNIIKGALPKK